MVLSVVSERCERSRASSGPWPSWHGLAAQESKHVLVHGGNGRHPPVLRVDVADLDTAKGRRRERHAAVTLAVDVPGFAPGNPVHMPPVRPEPGLVGEPEQGTLTYPSDDGHPFPEFRVHAFVPGVQVTVHAGGVVERCLQLRPLAGT